MSTATLPTRGDSSVDRPIGLVMRGDLECREHQYARHRVWAVKDPVSLKYFHLPEEEYAILTMLDGQSSQNDIRRRFEQRFAPRTLDHQQLHSYLATLHRHGLLLSTSLGQGEQLLLRQADARRRRRYQALASVLAIRFRGVNPRALLNWLAPKFYWLFSAPAVVAGLVLAVAALLLVTVQFDAFRTRLPEFRTILAASNLPWLALVLGSVKILHELGHAVACRRFGGDCHEMGFMLLVFTPCLYCNVSDAWMQQSKWRRMAISAAGMYVELILASLCTFAWWFSHGGLLNAVCLNTMILCSLGTIFINGNPLLRYDGYFILADFLEVPNLSAQSMHALGRLMARWCLGIAVPADRQSTPRREALLVAYAVASIVYRCLVVVAVLWCVRTVLRPYGQEWIVVVLALLTVAAMLGPSAVAAAALAAAPSWRRRMAPARAILTFALGAAAIGFVSWIPLPVRVTSPLVVEHRDALRVYVTQAGKLTRSVHYGDRVRQGETLATLDSPEVRLALARLTMERDVQRRLLADLDSRRLQGVIDGSQIPAATAALADAQQRLDQYERDARRLTLTAPTSGIVLPPPAVAPAPRGADKLERWTGMPLDDRNRGCFLETGTLVCSIGEIEQFEAIVHVDETDIELVATGQRATIKLDELRGQTFQGTVVEVAKLDLDMMPRQLAVEGDVPSRVDQRGVARPLDAWYQARIEFDAQPRPLVAGVRGRAKIEVAPQSIAAQFVRFLKANAQPLGRAVPRRRMPFRG